MATFNNIPFHLPYLKHYNTLKNYPYPGIFARFLKN